MYIVMTVPKAKGEWLQVRIDGHLKDDVRITAAARGLSMSALIHSILVQAVRAEKASYPHLFSKAAQAEIEPVQPRFVPDQGELGEAPDSDEDKDENKKRRSS